MELSNPAIESVQQRIALTIAQFRALAVAGAAVELEPIAAQLTVMLSDSRLPFDFVGAARRQMRELELTANMKACDMALRRAFVAPNAHRKPHRVAAVTTACYFLRRANLLGASAHFQRAAERTIEAALLTDRIWPEPSLGGRSANRDATSAAA
jgi:hypothetical protein